MEKITQYLSFKLREERKLRKWSLDKASKETGVSKAMLGQIERGESSPTVATLWKIATGFHTPLSHFLSPMNKPFGIEGNDSSTEHQGVLSKGIMIKTLSSFDDALGFEWFELTLSPGCSSMSDPHDKGVVELVTVIKGELEIFAEGQWRTLSQGEVIRFAADAYHGYRNTTKNKVIFHDVILYRN